MVIVVDYDMGNPGSIINMFRRLGVDALLTRDPSMIAAAEKLVLPGVGAFDHGMANLEKLGLVRVLVERVVHQKIPILGICLGMQLMTARSEEGVKSGLAWIEAETVHFRVGVAEASSLKLPHIGWNFVESCKTHPLLAGLSDDARFYFVHSYKVVCRDAEDVLTETRFGDVSFTSAYARDNIVGVQFHPEKSHRFGAQLLQNFSQWQGNQATSTRDLGMG